ncbi:MAG: aspartate carbamoyltransferase [Candidatus Anstonellales archaeon]
MDIISVRDIDKKMFNEIFEIAGDMERQLKSGRVEKLDGVVATLFFEPSTRTKLSFQSAAVRLGLRYIDFISELSSVKKGESFADTVRMVDGYCDIIVMRHKYEGAARYAAEIAKASIINGGDGGNQHPTQTMLDLYTILKEKGRINGLNVRMMGDLKHARTMHSLIYALAMFGANISVTAPHGLEMPKEGIEEIEKKFNMKISIEEEPDFSRDDVLYVTRIQQERFADPLEAKRIMEKFRITKDALKDAKNDMIIMHPLPRVSEIDIGIDKTKHAKYFEQARNGIPVRMALIKYILGGEHA